MLKPLPSLLFACLTAPLAAQAPAPAYVSGEILICARQDRDAAVAERLRAAGCVVREVDAVSGVLRVAVAAGREDEEVARWASDDDVAFAERNGIGSGSVVPDDTHFPSQWHLRNTGQSGGTAGADIRAVDAWDLSTGSAGVVIAVLDTGIDSDHPDFVGRIDPDGYDFVNDDSDPEGDHPHGTQVASVLGANGNNGFGVTGVDWQCGLLPIKVLDATNTGSTFDLTQGLNYCAMQADVRVISMSLQNYPISPTLAAALQLARANGKILIASAGNGGIGHADVSFPGASPLTMSIGATTNADSRAAFSGTGIALDFVAPGVSIVMSRYGSSNNQFSFGLGTSFSAPIVAGVVGLVLARVDQLGLTPPTHDQVRDLLVAGALDQVGPAAQDPPGRDDLFGHGRIDARLVLDAVPTLRNCGNGDVGLGSGGPFQVLRIDGMATSGGFPTIPVLVGNAATLSVDVPPTLPQPGPVPPLFLLVAYAGGVGTGSPVTLPFGWGEMCFDPSSPNVILQIAGLAPWSAVTPPVPPGFTTSLQAVLFDSPQADVAVSNLVVLDAFSVPPPTIASVVPPVAASGSTVVVDGLDFQPGIALTIDGVAVAVSAATATSVSFVVPAGVGCDATLTLRNPDNQSASAPFNASPVVTTVSAPAGTPAAGGTILLLIGHGFAPGTTVTIGGNAMSTTSVVLGLIVGTLPPGNVGPAAIVITTPGGCTATASLTYTP